MSSNAPSVRPCTRMATVVAGQTATVQMQTVRMAAVPASVRLATAPIATSLSATCPRMEVEKSNKSPPVLVHSTPTDQPINQPNSQTHHTHTYPSHTHTLTLSRRRCRRHCCSCCFLKKKNNSNDS